MKAMRIMLLLAMAYLALRVVVAGGAAGTSFRDRMAEDPRLALAVVAASLITGWGLLRALRRPPEE